MADLRRVLLVVNPNAQTVSAAKQEVAASTLASGFRVEQAVTEGPGHATELAHKAAYGDVDVVVVLGGDGTINEVANALAGTRVALGIVPGGGADVFARSVGIPRDAGLAARSLLEWGSGELHPPRVPLGRVAGSAEGEGRYFLANCGMGFDAAIVRSVERHPRAKRRIGDWFFVWTGVKLFFRGIDRRHPHVELAWGEGRDQQQRDLFLAVLQNLSPYTFLGRHALRLCPHATLEDGLDCFAVDTMRARTILPLLLSAFGSARHVQSPCVTHLRNLSRIRIGADLPMPVQVDGEFIGERTEIVVESVADALAVICGPPPP